ncbi:MAG: 4-hydroxy-3-methylbut-2-enyl diphosphate reductase [Pelatocladus maniniholoensis HA4357-MV3]|jgi:4-hydroxy-3-methylbut-2-enyl diphosphate reductase|uniref:4-hydroxy-3-methylbut-2-enyl diphosphate reductase n=1 Tax=Pelatocladus maniniholoensis HA4357-MV3 TaxID=1117104 RepID=A0A9E3HC49_9NOST|nr:4-hydroxy-3-methylbut-2-enyl diphosphate reductase [Pelatocladus maniniholoensis HA4357-MV3]BAZ70685.1 hydroxymethylbutenyl pyrophosphate reductase [Fischerella sp. NIES-4106]
MDTKALKRSLHNSNRYYRNGFGHKVEATERLHFDYQSGLIQQIRENGYKLQRGDVTIRLAEAFGFCWGVERVIALTYETRKQFPTERIWITNEIIHNPTVNQNLTEMQIEFIPMNEQGQKDFAVVTEEDVVILPAFGATIEEIKLLNTIGCTIVDTTCPWVSKVWNSVEKHKKQSYTSIIHGKYKHEETIATSSYADKYLVILNLQQAEYVCNYILNGGDREEFLSQFAGSYSFGFDPDTDLERIGIANQTTMLKRETEQIGKLFERTLMRKYGPSQIDNHFLSFNTICDATQERQDAMFKLVEEKIDLMVVVGGFNSSNTTHLQEIALGRGIPSYHIDSVERLGPGNRIQHKKLNQDLEVVEEWLPQRPVVVGITAGASTPDTVVSNVIERLFEIKSAM